MVLRGGGRGELELRTALSHKLRVLVGGRGEGQGLIRGWGHTLEGTTVGGRGGEKLLFHLNVFNDVIYGKKYKRTILGYYYWEEGVQICTPL